jgi:hypothetical protein
VTSPKRPEVAVLATTRLFTNGARGHIVRVTVDSEDVKLDIKQSCQSNGGKDANPNLATAAQCVLEELERVTAEVRAQFELEGLLPVKPLVEEEFGVWTKGCRCKNPHAMRKGSVEFCERCRCLL